MTPPQKGLNLMDFGALTPEINSARMYSGPGAEPLLAAASAWDRLAGDLQGSAAAYRSTITGLTASGWQGPSAMQMADTIGSYLTWMHTTAAQVEQTAAQARAAVDAYQTAFAMTVPPPLIAANRAQLSALVAGNFFGQNSPAIAATETHYEQMWARDAAAMYGYAASSATAAQFAPFSDPPPSTVAASPALLTYLLQIPSLTSAAASVSSSSFGAASIQTTNHALAVNAVRDEAQGIGPFLVAAPPAQGAAVGRASLVGGLSVPQAWAASTAAPPATSGSPPVNPAFGVPAAATLPASGLLGEAVLGGALAAGAVGRVTARRPQPSVIPRSPAAG